MPSLGHLTPASATFGSNFFRMPPSIASIEFAGDAAFEANDLACRALEEAGFSIGRMEHRSPRGLLFGSYDIQKWRNLNAQHRRDLHGALVGDMRNGPVKALLFPAAPGAARGAFLAISRRAV